VLAGKLALHVVGQLIPEGLLETLPVPVPARLTVNTGADWVALKVAVTCWLALSVTVQVEPLPLHAPPHPAKDELAPGVSVRVTWVPALKLALHVVGQLIPGGLLDTAPVPVPARVTVSTGALWLALNVAVTCSLALSVTVQVVLLPLHPPPDQPAKDELAAGVSVSVT
jgi:hypothetical protein